MFSQTATQVMVDLRLSSAKLCTHFASIIVRDLLDAGHGFGQDGTCPPQPILLVRPRGCQPIEAYFGTAIGCQLGNRWLLAARV